MNNMKKCNITLSVIFLVISAFLIKLSLGFKIDFSKGDPGSGFWPLLLASLLCILSIVLLITTLMNGKKESEKEVVLKTPANIRVYIIMALVVVFCVSLYFLGFYISTFLFIPVFMYTLDVRDIKKMFIISALFIIFIYVVFGLLLKTQLPMPIFIS